MKRKTTIIRSAVAAASAVGLSLAAPVMAEGTDKAQEQSQMEQSQQELEQQQQKVGGEEEQAKKGKHKAAIDPQEVQRVFGSDVQIISLEDLPSEQIRTLQQELQALDLYKGEVDGVMGRQTHSAVKKFVSKQKDINEKLLKEGQVTTQLMDALGVSHSDIQPVTGVEGQGEQPKGQEEQPPPDVQQQEPPLDQQQQEQMGEEPPPEDPGMIEDITGEPGGATQGESGSPPEY